MLGNAGSDRRKLPLYVRDENAWMDSQLAILREGRIENLDTEHLVQFLMANIARNHRDLRRRLTILLRYLLDVRFRSDRLLRTWVSSILEQQRQTRETLRALPSLRAVASEMLEEAYADAVKEAAKDTGEPPHQLPRECPWTLEEALKFDVMPLIRRNRTNAWQSVLSRSIRHQ